jgi:hypothetical protein
LLDPVGRLSTAARRARRTRIAESERVWRAAAQRTSTSRPGTRPVPTASSAAGARRSPIGALDRDRSGRPVSAVDDRRSRR